MHEAPMTVEYAMQRVSGDGHVQIGTYFKEAKVLANEILRLRSWGGIEIEFQYSSLRGFVQIILDRCKYLEHESEEWKNKYLASKTSKAHKDIEFETLHEMLNNHERHWRAIANEIGTDGGFGGVDCDTKERFGNAEVVLRIVKKLKSQLNHGKSCLAWAEGDFGDCPGCNELNH